MHISILFQFKEERAPAAVTGVEGAVTDILLPSPGDLIHHRDGHGEYFTGRVRERMFSYQISDGECVQGCVEVTLLMDRVAVH